MCCGLYTFAFDRQFHLSAYISKRNKSFNYTSLNHHKMLLNAMSSKPNLYYVSHKLKIQQQQRDREDRHLKSDKKPRRINSGVACSKQHSTILKPPEGTGTAEQHRLRRPGPLSTAQRGLPARHTNIANVQAFTTELNAILAQFDGDGVDRDRVRVNSRLKMKICPNQAKTNQSVALSSINIIIAVFHQLTQVVIHSDSLPFISEPAFNASRSQFSDGDARAHRARGRGQAACSRLSTPANPGRSHRGLPARSGAQSGLCRQLYALDVASRRVSLLAAPPNQGNTEGNLSLEEKLRRERQRQMGSELRPTRGTRRYSLNAYCTLYKVIFTFKSSQERSLSCSSTRPRRAPQEAPSTRSSRLTEMGRLCAGQGALRDPQPRDGRTAGRAGDARSPRRRRQVQWTRLLFDPRGAQSLPWLLWSPDSSRIAFEEIDESHIPKFRIMHSGSAEPTRRRGAGGPSLSFRRCCQPQETTGVIKLPHAEQHDPREIPSVNWLPDHSLGVQRLNRLQTEMTFLHFDVHTGREQPRVLNANYLFRNIEAESKNTFRFLWGPSELDSCTCICTNTRLERRSASAGAVTSGKWSVESVEGIDLAQGRVYFSGTADSPLERHLYVTSLFPSYGPPLPPTRLTGAQGMHSIVMDSSCRMFVDVYSNTTTPPRALVCTVPSEAQIAAVKPVEPADLTSAAEPAPPFSKRSGLVLSPYNGARRSGRVSILQAQAKLCVPKIISFPTRDGKETLYGAVYLPDREIHGDGPYPTIVSVYGGPHVQRVAHMWAMTVDMRAQRFRDMVMLCSSFVVDRLFEGAIKHCMGTVEILDQEDGVRKLVDEGITIEGRLAIAGAPVTSWDGYDTCYTERYVYASAEPGRQCHGAVGNIAERQKLLLVHGLIDENVHFRHTARLITALINARKHYELLLFPGEASLASPPRRPDLHGAAHRGIRRS
ncbi:Alpha/Beta hydrolase fold [Phytophthora cactorum]|nr:Alpha/Beta hydrolase fold [Phytophthora cactorum]